MLIRCITAEDELKQERPGRDRARHQESLAGRHVLQLGAAFDVASIAASGVAAYQMLFGVLHF